MGRVSLIGSISPVVTCGVSVWSLSEHVMCVYETAATVTRDKNRPHTRDTQTCVLQTLTHKRTHTQAKPVCTAKPEGKPLKVF